MALTETFLSQLQNDSLANLRQSDRRWYDLRNEKATPSTVINQSSENLGNLECDLVFCGGTLGILLATALQQKGWKVALIERGILRGREQEWNISRHELNILALLYLV